VERVASRPRFRQESAAARPQGRQSSQSVGDEAERGGFRDRDSLDREFRPEGTSVVGGSQLIPNPSLEIAAGDEISPNRFNNTMMRVFW